MEKVGKRGHPAYTLAEFNEYENGELRAEYSEETDTIMIGNKEKSVELSPADLSKLFLQLVNWMDANREKF